MASVLSLFMIRNLFHDPFHIGYLNVLLAKSDNLTPYAEDDVFIEAEAALKSTFRLA